MSNRNFDASVITKRLGNKAIAKSIISNFNNVNTQPQTSNMNASIINEVELGNSLFVTRGLTCTTYDLGCPCFSPTTLTPIERGWATRIAGPRYDIGYSITVDSNNNVIVTGSYRSSPAIIYNADGTEFGTLPNSDSLDAFIVKYNSNGFGIWATRIAGSGDDEGYSITVDSNNNIIITGSYSKPVTIYNADGSTFGTLSNNSSSSDAFIVKYNSNGIGTWATRIGGAGDEYGNSITVDSNNNIIVTGHYSSDPVTIYNAPGGDLDVFGTLSKSGDNNVFIVKYNSNGVGTWATRIAGSGTEFGWSVTSDSNNNIIVTGSYTSNPVTIYNAPGGDLNIFGTLPSSGPFDAFIVKYNSNGFGTWATRIGGAGDEYGYSITVDSNNNIIVIGSYRSDPVTIYNAPGGDLDVFGTLSNIGLYDAFIVKYNSNGVGTWATRIAGAGNEYGNSITVDSNNNIIVTGQYGSNPVTIYNAPGGDLDVFGTLSKSGDNNVFIVKYNSNGVGTWATRIAGAGSESGIGITVDSNNNVIVTGFYRFGSAIIYNADGSEFGKLDNSDSTTDAFIVKYKPNGFVN